MPVNQFMKKEPDRILLYVDDGHWFEQHFGNEIYMHELFGTVKIPTPYEEAEDPERIKYALQEMHPDAKIEIAEVLIMQRTDIGYKVV